MPANLSSNKRGGDDVNKTDQCSFISLHCARPHVSKHLILDYIPLMLAARDGHDKCVELLIETGANIYQQNMLYGTPLMMAMYCRYCIDYEEVHHNHKNKEICIGHILQPGANVTRVKNLIIFNFRILSTLLEQQNNILPP